MAGRSVKNLMGLANAAKLKKNVQRVRLKVQDKKKNAEPEANPDLEEYEQMAHEEKKR
jgi:hypothetical protein